MDILNQFGFDIRLFAAQIVNFLVIAFIFKKFLYKPILETLNKRASVIKKGLQPYSELATKALEDAESQKDELLKKASSEAERILAESKIQSISIREEMMAETKEEISKMMEQTKEQIVLERENFKKEAKDMSLEIAQKILLSTINDLFDKKDRDILLKKGIQKLKNDKQTKN